MIPSGMDRPMRSKRPRLIKVCKMEEGNMAFDAGKLDEAINLFSESLEQDPGRNEALLSRARCYMKSEQYEEAIKDYEKLLKSDSRNYEKFLQKRAQAVGFIRALCRRGDLYMDTKRYDEAINDYDKAGILEEYINIRSEDLELNTEWNEALQKFYMETKQYEEVVTEYERCKNFYYEQYEEAFIKMAEGNQALEDKKLEEAKALREHPGSIFKNATVAYFNLSDDKERQI